MHTCNMPWRHTPNAWKRRHGDASRERRGSCSRHRLISFTRLPVDDHMPPRLGVEDVVYRPRGAHEVGLDGDTLGRNRFRERAKYQRIGVGAGLVEAPLRLSLETIWQPACGAVATTTHHDDPPIDGLRQTVFVAAGLPPRR